MSEQAAIKSLEKELKQSYELAQREIEAKLEITLEKISAQTGNVDNLLAEKARLEELKINIAHELSAAGARAEYLITGNNKKLLKFSILETEKNISESIDMSIDWNMTNEYALNALFTDAQSIYDIRAFGNLQSEAVIMQRVNNEFVAATMQGEGIPELTKRIQQLTGRSLNDARRIARTHSRRIYNAGRFFGYNEAARMGIRMSKQWVSTYDGRTRKSHKMMQGETVRLNEEFSNGLRYPADPNGSAEEVINCRCAVSGILDDYSDYSPVIGNTRNDEIDLEISELVEEWK